MVSDGKIKEEKQNPEEENSLKGFNNNLEEGEISDNDDNIDNETNSTNIDIKEVAQSESIYDQMIKIYQANNSTLNVVSYEEERRKQNKKQRKQRENRKLKRKMVAEMGLSPAEAKKAKLVKHCDNCKLKTSLCLHGQFLEEFFNKPEGLRVKASGNSWTPDFVGKIGTVVSTQDTRVQKFLKVLWDGESKAQQFTFLCKMKPKFIIHCTSSSSTAALEPLNISKPLTEMVEPSLVDQHPKHYAEISISTQIMQKYQSEAQKVDGDENIVVKKSYCSLSSEGCSKSFYTSELRVKMRHEWYVHYIDVYYKRSRNKIECSICSKRIRADSVPLHMFIKHKGTPVPCPFNCSLKNLTFKNFYKYWTHLRNHQKFVKDKTNSSNIMQTHHKRPTDLDLDPRSKLPLMHNSIPDYLQMDSWKSSILPRNSQPKSHLQSSSLTPIHHGSYLTSASIDTPDQNQEQPIFGKSLSTLKTLSVPTSSSVPVSSSSQLLQLPQPVAIIKRP